MLRTLRPILERHPWRRRYSSTSLRKVIVDGIKATGPIPLATYMQLCLSHPTHGYYMSSANDIFGTRGDFVTSPEISSVFGEILGVWFMYQWMNKRTMPIRLVEMGPGRGVLMNDILGASTFKTRRRQTITLCSKGQFALEWHDTIDEIKPNADVFTMVVAHEFFDALPFHLIERTEQGWQEILVALADETPDQLRYVLAPQPTAASTLLGLSSPRFLKLAIGSRLEVSPVSFKTMRSLGSLVAGNPGCGLIIDYGDAKPSSGSFRVRCSSSIAASLRNQNQAFKNHQIVDPFSAPGASDLTANVDFGYLTEAIADLVPVHGPLAQGLFLERMGLHERLQALARKVPNAENLLATAERLVDPNGMGAQYKVLGFGGGQSTEEVWPFITPKE
ncbi:Protein arginine methyltransferase NDUFAF7 [Mycena kentingensis (nom. inval.)]|nr:Protein arginine methyltransferase NDUFAF7 [Mycena kentingensis (nom. inval.)]